MSKVVFEAVWSRPLLRNAFLFAMMWSISNGFIALEKSHSAKMYGVSRNKYLSLVGSSKIFLAVIQFFVQMTGSKYVRTSTLPCPPYKLSVDRKTVFDYPVTSSVMSVLCYGLLIRASCWTYEGAPPPYCQRLSFAPTTHCPTFSSLSNSSPASAFPQDNYFLPGPGEVPHHSCAPSLLDLRRHHLVPITVVPHCTPRPSPSAPRDRGWSHYHRYRNLSPVHHRLATSLHQALTHALLAHHGRLH